MDDVIDNSHRLLISIITYSPLQFNPSIRAIANARKGMRNPAKRVFGVFWWGHTPTKTHYFLSSDVGNRPNAIALIRR